MDTSADGECVCFRTVQGTLIRIVLETIIPILQDANIHFRKDGVFLNAMDSNKIALCYMRIGDINATTGQTTSEYYKCEEECTITVNVRELYIRLKTLTHSDQLCFKLNRPTDDFLSVSIESKTKRTMIEYGLRLLTRTEEELALPEMDYDTSIRLPSSDWQRHIRDIKVIEDYVTLSVRHGNELVMEANGLFGNCSIVQQVSKGDEDHVLGEITPMAFNVKFIDLFCKSSNLSSTVTIQLHKDFPLIITYTMGNLGFVRYCLGEHYVDDE